MAIGFSLPGAPEFERDLAYYIRETEQATAFYCRLGHGEWEKSVTKRQPMDKTVNGFWTAAFRNGFMDFAKDVQFGVKEGAAQTYLVTVDGRPSASSISRMSTRTSPMPTCRKRWSQSLRMCRISRIR